MDDHKESFHLTSRIHTTRSTEDGLAHVDLNKNVEALIENPLAHLTPEQLLRDVRDFARSKHLEEHLDLLKKGAQIAKDPRFFEAIRGITEVEKKALRDEEHHRFRQPIALYVTIITCSVGAAVQGWDQTGSAGANLNWPQAFGLDTQASSNDVWIFGLVNAAPYFASALLGCWLSHPLNHRIGRRGTIFISAFFCFASVIGSAFTQTWQQLFACRLLLGIGMGTKASTIPVFAAENSPAIIRGSLVMGWQLWVAFGILMGSSANLAVYQVGKIAWRLQLGSAFIPAVPLLVGIYMCPESPRWYIKKHRYNDAFRSLCRLRNTPLQAARDLYYIHAQVRLEEIMLGDGDIQKMNIERGKEHFTSRGRYLARLVQLFTIARVRRATLAAFVVMIAQQMCGINIMAFYSSTLFVEARASQRTALFASWGFGLINFVFAWPAVRTIDTFGRRALLLVTFPNMAWTLLAAGFSFYIPESSAAHIPIITLFIYLFSAFYSPGEGPVPFTYSAEAFPLFHREVGMSLAVAVNLFWAGVLTVAFPRMISAFGPTGAIVFFAGLNVLALIMIFLWVPETKQRTLEELDYIFAVPTRQHMRYQAFEVLPWAFRRATEQPAATPPPQPIPSISPLLPSADVLLLPSPLFPMTFKVMEQPPVAGNSAIANLCDVILETLRSFGNATADINIFRGEVQTLRRFLDLIERIRKANAPRTAFEDEHFSDVEVLLDRCRITLSRLCEILAELEARCEKATPQNALQEALVELQNSEILALRARIRFYTLSFQMSLQTIKLVYQWKSQLPQDGIYFHHKDLRQVLQRLKEAIAHRKGLSESDTLHSPIQEETFLYDVEKCVFSAEIIMNVTTTTVYEDVQSPKRQLPFELPGTPAEQPIPSRSAPDTPELENQSHVGFLMAKERRPPAKRKQSPLAPALSPESPKETLPAVAYRTKDSNPSVDSPTAAHISDINAKHRGSIDSDNESIFDPEPEFEDSFPAAVYSELISGLQQEVQREMQAGRYSEAEQPHRRAMEYMTDRERKLGIPFDHKPDMHETLAIIYTRQGQLKKAKQVLSHLLTEEKGETDRKWRLYHAVAEIYHEQGRIAEAEKFAKRAYIGREKTLEKDNILLLESVNLLVTIYELQHKTETADALRRVYRAQSIPPEVPPKSKQRETASHIESDETKQSVPPRVRWAPDVWVDSSSINAPTRSGETPLISAILTGDHELVKLILQRGADVEARCVDKITPLMHATSHGFLSVVEVLLDKGAQLETTTAGWSALQRAADLANIHVVNLLLARGADIEARGPRDFSPKKHPLARIPSADLEDYDAVDASDADIGWTALLRAASDGQEQIVRLLLSNGAHIEARNPSNGTPLICAAEGNHEAIVDFLLMNGASVDAEDDFGWKPLHRALVSRGGAKVAQMLLTHGADINARCAYRKTPLHHAIEKGNDPMVSFLLAAGADYEARDIAERTPLQTAIESRLEIMVRILLDAGADTDAKDKGGHDALAAANHALRRSPEIINLLAKQKKAKRGSVGNGSRENSVSGSSMSRTSSSASWWSLRSKQKKRA